MTPEISLENTKLISAAIELLRSCCQQDILAHWKYLESNMDIEAVMASDLNSQKPVELNEKRQITWDGGKKVLWLGLKLQVPEDLQGYALSGLSLRLALLWWADSVQVYVNGELAVEGDLFDCAPRVLLSTAVQPGEEFFVALRLVSPGHCDGALVKSLLVYESACEDVDAGFVADELEVVRKYLEVYEPQNLAILQEIVEQVILCRDTARRVPTDRNFNELVVSIREKLKSKIKNPKSKIYLLGHAHLDMAWLWRVCETWRAAESTFESVLKLQEDFPELVFCHSTPALYAWVEENRPELFQAIQEKIKQGSWEVLGGFWVEPELNLISGESLARQLLYGQRYCLQKFGQISPIVWVPDTFGFCWTLPQFMQQGGIEYFVTQKLRWNDSTKFPHAAFWWRSPDGSEVLSYMSAPIGEGIDPVKMAAYKIEWHKQTDFTDALWLPGVGDHGGGPTRDMLEIAQRWQKSPVFPELEFTTAEKYLQQLKSRFTSQDSKEKEITPNSSLPTPNSSLPIWNDELYLEYHRGCYTTHADQKRFNRKSENLLYQAELFASIATITTGLSYPKLELEKAWKQVLFNQFHDILPGSSITEVYTDALPEWQEVTRVGNEILQQSLATLAAHINLAEPPQADALPIIVFNALNWQRSEVVSLELPATISHASVSDSHGKTLPCMVSESSKVLFIASDIPSVGYKVFWLCPANESSNINNSSTQSLTEKFTIENELLRVIIDEQTGNIASIFDKNSNQEILNGAGNELQAFGDSGQYWDAWNIDPNYAEHPLPPAILKSIELQENNLVQKRIRIVRQIGESEFCQDYILQANSGLLKIATTVNWKETHVMVKAAFPLNIEADKATYEIPCGTISRTTKPETPAEKAKWEVPALNWADLTSGSSNYGVSLLNDCKYGYDAKPNQLRLTLLRSPKWPDSEADKGFHEFTYALYPHASNIEDAQTVRHGFELNNPLQTILLTTQPAKQNKSLPSAASFLNLYADNLVLMAFKQAEDNPQQWILRCYESHGKNAQLSLQGDLGLSIDGTVDLLERPTPTPEFSSSQQNLTISPWTIVSLRVRS